MTEEKPIEKTTESLENENRLKMTNGGLGCTIKARIDVVFYAAADRGQDIDEEDLADWWDWKVKQGYIILVDGDGTVYMVHAKNAEFLGGGMSREKFLEMAGEGRWLETE